MIRRSKVSTLLAILNTKQPPTPQLHMQMTQQEAGMPLTAAIVASTCDMLHTLISRCRVPYWLKAVDNPARVSPALSATATLHIA